MVSPLCEVKDGAGAYASTAAGVDVTPTNTITIRLADSNVNQWELTCATTDDANVAATINAGLSVDAMTKTATFTMPAAAGAALRFRSRVNGGLGPDGVLTSSYSTTFCIYSLIGGARTIAQDEATERGQFGWTESLNDLIRGGVGGVPVGATYSVGPTGSGALYLTDGTADEVQINAAIAALAAVSPVDGGVVRLLPGTYYIAAPINLASGVVLEGVSSDSTHIVVATGFLAANDWAVGAAGSLPTGTSCPLASNASQGATTITATADAEYALMAVDDFVFLSSDGTWETTNLSLRERGEFVKIASKASPNLTLYGMIRDSYTTANTARLYRVTFVESCGIRNLSISQQDALGTRTGGAQTLVSFQMCRNAFIEGCELYRNDGPGIGDMHSIGTSIRNNYIHDLADDQPNNLLGYGVIIGGASESTVVHGNRFGRMRHCIDAGPHVAAPGFSAISNNGIPRGVVISGNTSLRCANVPYSTHSEAEGWTFTGNHAENAESIGFYMRGRSMSLVGNTVRWCSGGIQVGNSGAFNSSGGSGSGSQVVGNTVSHCKSITPGTTGTNFGGYGIVLAGTDNVTVTGNSVYACDAGGIRLRPYARRNLIKGNTVVNANLANTANISAIELDSAPNGTAATLTYAAGTVTVTGISGLIDVAVGKSIVISGAATALNNGTFTIVTVVGTTSVTYANASGATDANNGAISWYVESITDNIFDGNVVMNTAASDYDRDCTGHAKYMVRDNGTANTRNSYTNNTAVGMETGRFLLTGTDQYLANNSDGLGTSSGGNAKQDDTERTVIGRTTDGTPLILLTVPSVTGHIYAWKGTVHGGSGGGAKFCYTINAFFDNNAGTLTQRITSGTGGTCITDEYESSASASLVLAVSGTDMVLTWTGVAGTTVRLHGRIFISDGTA